MFLLIIFLFLEDSKTYVKAYNSMLISMLINSYS